MVTQLEKTPMSAEKNINIAVLYAEADQKYWEGLERHLNLLKRKKEYDNVRVWSVSDVQLDTSISHNIRQELRKADITLLLLSIDFLNENILDEETRILLDSYAQQHRDERYVLPIIVNHFTWHDSYDDYYDLEHLRVIDKLVNEDVNEEEVYSEIVDSLEKYIEDINAKSIHLSIPTWIGYIGGILYNNGFQKSRHTSLYEKYARQIRFDWTDNTSELVTAWNAGETNIIWSTLDRLPNLISELKDEDLKIIFQASWSKGADAIISRENIDSVADLKGKKILYPFDSCAKTLLKASLQKHGLSIADVTSIPQRQTDLDLIIKHFIADESIAAIILWSPYVEACLNEATAVKVLDHSANYPNLIADVLLTSQDYLDLNKEELIELFHGWLEVIEEFKTDKLYRTGSIGVLVEALIRPLPSIIPSNIRKELVDSLGSYLTQSVEKVHFCNFDENLKFFGLLDNIESEGKTLYERLLKENFPDFYSDPAFAWDHLIDSTIMEGIKDR